MRLTPFRLHQPRTVEAAGELMAELGDQAFFYCGGTELLLVAKLGLTDFTDLVDVKRIDELSGIEGDGELRIGATTTHRQIERSPLVLRNAPSMAAMERSVGNLRVRTVGTIGGNLCFADPHSDPATYLIAAGGTLSVRRGGAAERRLTPQEFVRGPYQNALAEGEVLTAVHVPVCAPGSAIVHRKMSFHERPAITVAARVSVADGVAVSARIAIGSVGVSAMRATDAEQALVGIDALAPGAGQLAACGDAAAAQSEPVEDSNGSVEYKRQLVRVLSSRVVSAALAQAAGSAAGA